MNDLLKKKVAVVTGSGRGIGAAIAEKLGEFGASVIVTDINVELAEKVATAISEKYSLAKHHYFDVSDIANIQATVEKIQSLFGRIDIWVNNAGITATQSVEDITEEQWDRIQDINLKGLFFCTQSVFKIMKDQNYGRIVHISSMAGVRGGRSSSAAYSSAKAGVINLSKCFALAGGPFNVTSNTVCPGRILSEMAQGLSWLTDPQDDPAKTIPAGRFGTPEDIANAVIFYASDLSAYVTGDTMGVNGGLYMH